MNPTEKAAHERALFLATAFRKLEAQLLQAIQKIDEHKVFRKLGYSSLFQYCTDALKLSESTAYNFINVARKSREVPAIQQAITQGVLSVSKARKIIPVINSENQQRWLEAAVKLSTRELERQVAEENPIARTPERIKPVSQRRSSFLCGISLEIEKKLKRVQDLLSQKQARSASYEEMLDAMAECYLQKNDPVLRARRVLGRKASKSQSKAVQGADSVAKLPVERAVRPPGVTAPVTRQVFRRTPIPREVAHQVHLSDEGRCTFHLGGKRCSNSRFLELHHLVPVHFGGGHSAQNLVTLCQGHHRLRHGG